MMDSIRENKRAALLLLGALIALILAGVYFLYIQPLKDQNEAKSNSNNLIKAEITALQSEQEGETPVLPNQEDPYDLMKKVPTSLEIDKIIRSIEEVEMITGTLVTGISFAGYETREVTGFADEEEDVVVAEPEEQAEDPTTDDETPEPGDSSTEAREEDALEEDPIPTISAAELPLELKMITMTVDFTAETEEQLVAIMKEIENLERIYRVDLIETGQPGEEQLTDTEVDPEVVVSITLSTFYYVE